METKKRILVFIPEFPVLTETFIERELAKLEERGNVDLKVFSLAKGKGEVSEILENKIVYERPCLKDFFLSLPYIFSNLSRLKKIFLDLETKAKELDGGEEKDNISNSPKKLYTFIKSILYSIKFSKHKPDFILAHFLSSPSTIVMCASEILQIPYGISAHAKDIMVTGEFIREKVQTSKFITICNKNAYEYVLEKAAGLDTSKIFLKYHGVDVPKIIKRVENKDFKSEKPLILAVGRLVEKKGLIYLIESASLLKNRGLRFEIGIIGSGPLYENLKEEINSRSLQNEVKIIGDNEGLSNEETLVHFKSASVFAFPSIQTDEGDVDGVANVLMEAGIFRTPVVTTDAGGVGEIISDGVTGLVVSQKNSQELADKIELILKDSELGRKLGENLYNKVLEKFDLNNNIIELENLLR
jgi:colanic acid/amylovoran biosynthesis glycosyltransferase